jgi:hypothetical protein
MHSGYAGAAEAKAQIDRFLDIVESVPKAVVAHFRPIAADDYPCEFERSVWHVTMFVPAGWTRRPFQG